MNPIAPDGCEMWPLFTFGLGGDRETSPLVQLVGSFEAQVGEVVWGIVTAG